MIKRVECFGMQPKDRDYNKHGKNREPQIEILGGGISYCLRTEFIYGLLIWEEESVKLRIRKLTEGECMRLMGIEKKDTDAMRQAGLSRANIYHTAGDGLVTTIIAGLVGSLLGIDYKKDIEEYVDKLHNEVI